ncbi:MAG: glycosyltransferase family 39 protein [Candidatus Omnitrophota bacterium]|nr:glycosyltransferase family 39 protein [Candidatus Omnitrophota bacterium]
MGILFASSSRFRLKNENVVVAILAAALVILTLLICSSDLSSHSIWLDEAETRFNADKDKSVGEVVNMYTRRGSPPLYFLVIHEVLKIRDDEISLRMPSVIFGAGLILAVFLLARKLFGNGVGFFAALAFFLSDKFLHHARDANPYTMYAFLTTLSTYCLWCAWETRRKKDWLIYAAVALLAVGTHLFAVLFVFGQMVTYLFLIRFWEIFKMKSREELKAFIEKEKCYFVVAGVFGVISAAWLLFYFASAGSRPTHLYEEVVSASFWLGLAKSAYFAFFPLKRYLVFIVLGLAYYIISDREKGAYVTAVAVVPAILQIAALSTGAETAPRYFITTAPLLYIVAASSIRLGQVLVEKARVHKAVGIGITMATLLFFVQPMVLYKDTMNQILHKTRNYSWRHTAQLLDHHATENDIILVCADYMMLPLEYYYKGSVERIGIEKDNDDPAYFNRVVDANLIGKQRVWLILSHVRGDQPIVDYLNHFKRKLRTQSGAEFTIMTRQVGFNPMADIAIVIYELGIAPEVGT